MVNAATKTWTGTTSTDWADASNWGGTALVNGDDVVLTGAGGSRPTNQSIVGLSLNSITFDASTTTAFNVGGAGDITLTLAGTALTVNALAANHAISCNIALGANQTWSQGNAGTLTVSGAISETGGARSLTKTGAGVFVFSNANSYSGGTIINVGTLSITNDGNLGAATAPVSFTGGTLLVTGTDGTNSQRLGQRSIMPAAGAKRKP